MKKTVYLVLVIMWMLIILLFSSQNGDESRSLTIEGIDKVISNTEKTYSNQPDENKLQTIDTLIKPVRKSAHFFEYLVLGVLVSLLLKEFPLATRMQIMTTILFCVFYACTDELHQFFVEGRTARIFDVFIDGLGAGLGVCIFQLFHRKRWIDND